MYMNVPDTIEIKKNSSPYFLFPLPLPLDLGPTFSTATYRRTEGLVAKYKPEYECVQPEVVQRIPPESRRLEGYIARRLYSDSTRVTIQVRTAVPCATC